MGFPPRHGNRLGRGQAAYTGLALFVDANQGIVQASPPAGSRLTVAICTRNRPDDLRECVRTVLANPGPDFEVLVVDQSDPAAANDVLREFASDARLRHHVTASRGLSRARNEVLERARADVIAFTDDDCRVDSDWVRRVDEYFDARPEVALGFGRVVAPAELHAKGYVATFEPEDAILREFPSPMAPWGIGACMVLRRDAVMRAGAFDPELGAGSPIPAGEELDFTIRVLGAGLAVATTRAFEVTHLGVREHEAARKLFLGYVEGAGAAYAKNIRLRTPGAKRLFARWFAGVSKEVARAALTGRRPLGVGLLLAGLRGGYGVWRMPLDSRTRSFEDSAAQL